MTIHTDFEQDAKTVYKTMTDPEFLVDRNLALGEISAEYDVTENKDDTTITAVREVRRDMPGLLAKLFDPVNVIDMTENWHPRGDGWVGEWTLKVREQPVTVTGKFELAATESGCTYRVSHKVRAKVPLVSAQVQKFVMSQTARGAEDELEYLKNYLS